MRVFNLLNTYCVTLSYRTVNNGEVKMKLRRLLEELALSVDDRRIVHLEKAIREYVDFQNQHPKTFILSNTADEIFSSLARFCKRI